MQCHTINCHVIDNYFRQESGVGVVASVVVDVVSVIVVDVVDVIAYVNGVGVDLVIVVIVVVIINFGVIVVDTLTRRLKFLAVGFLYLFSSTCFYLLALDVLS